jgi:hypothetical protein
MFRSFAALLVLLTTPAVAASAALAQQPQNPSRREINIVPLIGGSSDVGFGVGQASDWVRLRPEYKPYRWRLASEAFITFKVRDETDVIVPFQDYAVQLTLPQLMSHKRLRINVRLSFTDETTLKYYGIGNASPEPPASASDDDVEYRRIHPTLAASARLELGGGFFSELGAASTYNWLEVPSGSLLGQMQASGSADLRRLLGDFSPHAVQLIEVGMLYDVRDNEVVTRRGMFHKLQARFSPAIPGLLPYAYQQVNATARFYTTPIPRWLTVSWRLVGDVLFGSPPFYELARFEQTQAIGGGKAVRGVPAQRYYGKVKLFQNLEADTEILHFNAWKKPMALSLAVFFDAGRTWTELGRRHPELDGTGLGLKYGVGGGVRLQQGTTFVVRGDIAWSPDARPIGAYFAAGEIF